MRRVKRRRIDANTNHKSRRRSDGITTRVQPAIEFRGEIRQADCVDIEDRGCVGIRSHFWGIACDKQQIAQAQGGSPQQVTQHAQQVAIATAIVRDGFNAVALDDEAAGYRTHAALRPRSIRHVNGINARFRECSSIAFKPRRFDATRWNDFDGCNKLSLRDLRTKTRPFNQRNWIDAGIGGFDGRHCYGVNAQRAH